MPRKKEYDRDAVLEKAMGTFWKKGFEGTSMQDLVDATGLNRFGLYQEFGNKEGLFNAALDFYRDNFVTLALTPLNQKAGDLDAIRNYFDLLVDHAPNSGELAGCLMTNTAIDSTNKSTATLDRVGTHMVRIEKAIFGCLTNAKKKGQIAPDTDIRELAQYFLGVSQGLAVFGRMNAPVEQMQAFVNVAMRSIDKPETQDSN